MQKMDKQGLKTPNFIHRVAYILIDYKTANMKDLGGLASKMGAPSLEELQKKFVPEEYQ